MATFIDRRSSTHKSAVNRERFMRRFKKQIQQAVTDAALNRSIKSTDGQKITIPNKDLTEPTFKIGTGGIHEVIHAGNESFIKGDKFKKPVVSAKQQTKSSNTGNGEDDFIFTLSRDEFLNLFFEDLELPNLVKTQLAKIPTYKKVKKGITQYGTPSNINIVRSMRQALGRKLAFVSPAKKQLQTLEKELQQLQSNSVRDEIKIKNIEDNIKNLKSRIKNIPFLDPFDLRYNSFTTREEPTTQAVMFCLMDVSGSMDEIKKEIAKKFFILLYLFLNKSYENVEVVFIRHHTLAKEVTEEEFFYSRETGGTVVSSALEMMQQIMEKRYPSSDWNIYAAQASDGDNWNNDSPRCQALLHDKIMPYVQYFSYVEIMPRHHQSLWGSYEKVKASYKNFSMQHIENANDIYPVFRSLFTNKQQTVNL